MKRIAIFGIIAVIVGGFAFYSLFSTTEPTESVARTTADEQVMSQDTSQSSAMVPESGTGAMSELLATEADLECTFIYTDNENGQIVNGTVFTSDNTLRIDSLLTDPALGEYVSSLILTADTIYLWSDIDGETYGIQTDREGEAEDETTEALNAPVGLEAPITYECQEWEVVDRSVFTPPSDVLFQDLSSMMQSGMEYGTIYEEGSLEGTR